MVIYHEEIMKKGFFFGMVFLMIGLGMLPGSVDARRGSLQIKGSDTMVNLAQAWAERYMEKNTGKFIAVTGGGSGTGFASLINGTCEIAIASRKMKSKEVQLAQKKGIYPKEFKVALDGLAVVVHPDQPISHLTINQLANIFSGKVENWKDLGGEDLKIVILSREVNSGTHVYFKKHVLKNIGSNVEFTPRALLLPSSQAIADEVSQNPSAIGYYGMGYISKKQKALSIALNENSGFWPPEVHHVMSGKYPISRPLYIYTNGEPTGETKDFLDYVLSDEGQQIVTEIDFVPIR